MNKYTSINRWKTLALRTLCVVACIYGSQAYACGEDECSTTQCGCELVSCAPTHAGSYCTSKPGAVCDLNGQCSYSCALWCTNVSNTCKAANGQNGASECGTV